MAKSSWCQVAKLEDGQFHWACRSTPTHGTISQIFANLNSDNIQQKQISFCLAAGWTMFEAIPNYQAFGMCSDNFSRIKNPFEPVQTRSGMFQPNIAHAYPFVPVPVQNEFKRRSKAVRNPFGFSRDFPLFSFMNLKVVEKHCLGNIRTAV